jgi:hypothetical protein
MNQESQESVLRDIADIIRSAISEDVGFILFLGTSAGTSYIGKVERSEAITLLDEWLLKTSGKLSKKVMESSCQVDDRLALERQCAQIGKTIAQVAQVLLFLFDYGDNGSLAYYTNMDMAREGVACWVKAQKEKI